MPPPSKCRLVRPAPPHHPRYAFALHEHYATIRLAPLLDGMGHNCRENFDPMYHAYFRTTYVFPAYLIAVLATIGYPWKVHHCVTRNSSGDEIANVNFLRRHLQPLLCSAPRKMLCGCQLMANVLNAVETFPKISTASVWCTSVTDKQTTDRRQTDGRQHIANVNS